MLVSSVVIVLREVLEAALMISILLALSRRLKLHRPWLLFAVGLGLAGSVAYANLLAPISELADGVGQELLNASLQIGVFLSLVVTVFQVARRRGNPGIEGAVLPTAMSVAVALAAAQEGAEIIIYVSGFLSVDQFVMSVGVGSFTGASIGFSIGVLFYYVLLGLPERRALRISLVLLGLVASSMCIQAAKLLIQADWLPGTAPIWDTSGLISENSLLGQLLYALVGYEATPSALEAGMYAGSLLTIGVAVAVGWHLLPARAPEDA